LLTEDNDEITAIIEESQINSIDYQTCEKDFRLIEIVVSKPFITVGFLAQITKSLVESELNVPVVSTFSKDYLLVRWDVTDTARNIFQSLGFRIVEP
jgi:hypothetical protein